MSTQPQEPRFRCPICETTIYAALPGGLFSCLGCSAVFRDPWLFTATQLQGYQVPEHARRATDPRVVYEAERARRVERRRLAREG